MVDWLNMEPLMLPSYHLVLLLLLITKRHHFRSLLWLWMLAFKFVLLFLIFAFNFFSLFLNWYAITGSLRITSLQTLHYVKSVCNRIYSGPYFPIFGLNTEKYGVPLRIQSKCGKIRTRITPNMNNFCAMLPLFC